MVGEPVAAEKRRGPTDGRKFGGPFPQLRFSGIAPGELEEVELWSQHTNIASSPGCEITPGTSTR